MDVVGQPLRLVLAAQIPHYLTSGFSINQCFSYPRSDSTMIMTRLCQTISNPIISHAIYLTNMTCQSAESIMNAPVVSAALQGALTQRASAQKWRLPKRTLNWRKKSLLMNIYEHPSTLHSMNETIVTIVTIYIYIITIIYIYYNLSVGYLLAASNGSTDELIPLDPGRTRIQKRPITRENQQIKSDKPRNSHQPWYYQHLSAIYSGSVALFPSCHGRSW